MIAPILAQKCITANLTIFRTSNPPMTTFEREPRLSKRFELCFVYSVNVQRDSIGSEVRSATNHRSLVVILCSSEQRLDAGRLLLRELRAKLERLADHEKRTVSDYVEKVLREHVELTSAYVQHADKTKRSASRFSNQNFPDSTSTLLAGAFILRPRRSFCASNDRTFGAA
jgi:hypothetical protein